MSYSLRTRVKSKAESDLSSNHDQCGAHKAHYPQPKAVGGRLIRSAIALLRRGGVCLPIDSDILVAVSGGSDSMALAHLLIHFGRRIVTRNRISILHINHGWRGEASARDAHFVRVWAQTWQVPYHGFRLKNQPLRGESWEDHARRARVRIFKKMVRRYPHIKIFTAHHADDLAETLLWRLFTGKAKSHGGGILMVHGHQIRPLLQVRKAALRAYLAQEGGSYREDASNGDGRFLRARMRQLMMPEIEAVFPQAVRHLTELAIRVQVHNHIQKSPIAIDINATNGYHGDLYVSNTSTSDCTERWNVREGMVE